MRWRPLLLIPEPMELTQRVALVENRGQPVVPPVRAAGL